MPIAVWSALTYKGTTLQDWPRIHLEIVEGGPDTSPETRGEDRTIPYLRGQVYGNRRATRLPIQLRGWVAGEGADEAAQRADTAAARQELYALFDVEGGDGELSVTTEDGTVWTIDAYPEVILPDSRPQVPTHWGIQIRLVAVTVPNWTAAGS